LNPTWGMAYAAPTAGSTTPTSPLGQPTTPTQPSNSILSSVGSLLGKVPGYLFPGVTGMIHDLPQNIQTPLSPQEVTSTLGGPITEFAFGSPRQRQVLQAGSEVAPFFMGGISPEGFANISNTIGPKVASTLFGQAGAQMAPRALGMISGAMRSAFNPAKESIPSRLGQTALSGTLGFGTGAVMEGIQNLLQKPLEQAGPMMTRLLHPAGTQLQEFNRNTGLDFGQEIANRDLDAIKGMSWPQLTDYFEGKSAQASQAVDDMLSKSAETVPAGEITDQIDNEIAQLQQPGKINPSVAINTLQDLKDSIEQNSALSGDTGEIPVAAMNELKRDAQNEADSAYGLNAHPPDAVKEYQNVARWMKEAVEKYEPNVGDMNDTTELYHTAMNAARKTGAAWAEKASHDVLGRLMSMSPWAGGAIATAIGGPGAGVGTLTGLGALNMARNAYFSPSVTTSVANSLQNLLQNPIRQGLQNAVTTGVTALGSAVAPKISQAVMNLISPQQPQIAPANNMMYSQ